ncbi:MAG: universal stress protein [Microlunatus sp.]|nr:universal stress protein [Microlunatus sp.]MDN5771546.1 universal stress protein [Microlunatus sp.]
MEVSPSMIAVGVDSSAEALAAARFGTQAAELRGLNLLLAHAVCPPATAESSAWLIERLRSQLRIPPTMEVNTVLDHHSPAALLKEVEVSAAMLVVGRRRVDRPEHSILGSLAAQLVASASRPLAVVPAGWTAMAWTTRPVLVAVDPTVDVADLLRFAFAEASRLEAPLLAVYAVPASSRKDPAVSLRAVEEALAASGRQEYPALSVAIELLVGEPDGVVVAASRRAVELVVGGPRDPHRRRGWTDSVARTAVRWANCPVVVVPYAGSAGEIRDGAADQAVPKQTNGLGCDTWPATRHSASAESRPSARAR